MAQSEQAAKSGPGLVGWWIAIMLTVSVFNDCSRTEVQGPMPVRIVAPLSTSGSLCTNVCGGY